MTDEKWFKIRKCKKIELYICLLVVFPMVYGLWFNIVFLVQYMTVMFCIAVVTVIYELASIIFDKIKKRK